MTERARPTLLRRIVGSVWFKAGIAALVVGLLVYYNRIDWRSLSALGETWPWLLAAFLLMFPPFAIVSYRFKVVLRSQQIDAPFGLALRWTMVGSFFDLAMPSSNGGDVIKAGLAARHVGAGGRTRAVMAVGFDRVLGLVGLFMLATVVGVLGWPLVRDVQGRGVLLAASAGASFGTLAVFRILGSRRLYNSQRFKRLFSHSRVGIQVHKLVRAFNDLRERPALLLEALGLSMVNHVFWCACLICIARAVGNAVPPVEGFIVFPLAIFGNIFGVAGGFGLGTAGFDLLLSLFLGIGNGALIGLLFQSLSAASKLAGLPFFLSARHRDPHSMEVRP